MRANLTCAPSDRLLCTPAARASPGLAARAARAVLDDDPARLPLRGLPPAVGVDVVDRLRGAELEGIDQGREARAEGDPRGDRRARGANDLEGIDERAHGV